MTLMQVFLCVLFYFYWPEYLGILLKLFILSLVYMRLYSLITTRLSIISSMLIMIRTFLTYREWGGEKVFCIFVPQYPFGNPMSGSVTAIANERKNNLDSSCTTTEGNENFHGKSKSCLSGDETVRQ